MEKSRNYWTSIDIHAQVQAVTITSLDFDYIFKIWYRKNRIKPSLKESVLYMCGSLCEHVLGQLDLTWFKFWICFTMYIMCLLTQVASFENVHLIHICFCLWVTLCVDWSVLMFVCIDSRELGPPYHVKRANSSIACVPFPCLLAAAKTCDIFLAKSSSKWCLLPPN